MQKAISQFTEAEIIEIIEKDEYKLDPAILDWALNEKKLEIISKIAASGKAKLTADDWKKYIEKHKHAILIPLVDVLNTPTRTEMARLAIMHYRSATMLKFFLDNGAELQRLADLNIIHVLYDTIYLSNIIYVLLEHPANCAGTDKQVDWHLNELVNGYSVLWSCAKYNNFDMIALLVKYGADVNQAIEPQKRRTALHHVVDRGYIDTAVRLLKLGADPYILDVDGYNAFETARQKYGDEMRKKLLQIYNSQISIVPVLCEYVDSNGTSYQVPAFCTNMYVARVVYNKKHKVEYKIEQISDNTLIAERWCDQRLVWTKCKFNANIYREISDQNVVVAHAIDISCIDDMDSILKLDRSKPTCLIRFSDYQYAKC